MTTAAEIPTEVRDPRRWLTLAVLLTTVLVAGIDSNVLNVAIPTMLHEFHTSIASLQWVLTGYSLTFGAFLIIGGRLSDIYGARRMFMIGMTLFGIGSLVAAIAPNVAVLVLGEAVIEGLGASMLVPATLGLIAGIFHGHERNVAFAAWGAVIGVAVAFGPLVGGFFTTNLSWRWAFGINVVVAPLAALAMLVLVRRTVGGGVRQRLDLLGAVLIAPAMVLLVFAISQGERFGWWTPIAPFTVGPWTVWPVTMPVAITPVALLGSGVLLFAFVRVQVVRERADASPLFAFSHLRRRSFRYGLVTLATLALGQATFIFLLSIVLQDGRGLSALDTGLWLVPSGVAIAIGSQLGERLIRRFGATRIVQAGLALQALGLLAVIPALSPTMRIVDLLPAFALYGVGIGFGGSQINTVLLSEIEPERAASASGVNTTVRMVGTAIGVAVVSALLSAAVLRRATELIDRTKVPAALKDAAIERVRAGGARLGPVAGASGGPAQVLADAVHRAVAEAARLPFLYCAVMLTASTFVSLLLPRVVSLPRSERDLEDEQDLAVVESEALAETQAVQ